MKLAKAIALSLAAIAVFAIIAVLVFLAMLCHTCGYMDSGRTISAPSQWYNYSAGNASFIVLDIYCGTLGENEINVLRSTGSNNISFEAISGPMIFTRSSSERYGDVLYASILSSYGSDMYYGGVRLNIYLPEGMAYDIKISTDRSSIHVAGFTGTNLIVVNPHGGDLTIDGGDYDYVYADNGGSISGRFYANNSTLRSGTSHVNVTTPQPA